MVNRKIFEYIFMLHSLNRMLQSRYTPFITENIYQSLRPFIPEDLASGNTRSVHFLSFPEVKEEYFDEVIERQVKRMQAVIDLTRNIRERHNISLKVLRSLFSAIYTFSTFPFFADTAEGTPHIPPRERIPFRRSISSSLYPIRTQRPRRLVYNG